MTPVLITTALLVALLLWREHATQQERRQWTRERGQLLNRIKPESAQAPLDGPDLETFQAPLTDEDFWEASGKTDGWRKD